MPFSAPLKSAGFVEFADALMGEAPIDAFIFRGAYAMFRDTFREMARELGLPMDGPPALTWGSRRRGGAAWLLRVTNNPELVRFQARWASSRMLETCVQEVGASPVTPFLALWCVSASLASPLLRLFCSPTLHYVYAPFVLRTLP